MRQIIILVSGAILFTSSSIFAQIPAPRPVVEVDLRDNTIKMRSAELERIKREANKPDFSDPDKVQPLKFDEIKEDFEDIQKLQSLIVKTYTTGKKIDYAKIGESASGITKKAIRLNLNLFDSKTAKDDKDKDKASKKDKPKSVKDLIIELDKAVGRFVSSPIFKNIKIIDPEVSEKSHLDLENVLKLSEALALEAGKLK